MSRLPRDRIANLVMEVLIVHGGLNERSKRALLEIARLYGLSADEILRVLERVARLEHAAAPRTRITAPGESEHGADEISQVAIEDAASRRTFRLVLGILTGLLYAASVTMLALTFITVRHTPSDGDEPPEQLVTPPSAVAVAPSVERPGSMPRRVATDPGEYDALLGPFDDASDRFRAEGSDAIRPIALSLETLSETWPSLDRTTVESAAARITNLLLELESMENTGYASQLLGLILAPSAHLATGSPANAALAPKRIVPAAWSLGLASRLSKERHPDPAIRATLEAHIERVYANDRPPVRPSFRDGAIASLLLTSRRMIELTTQPFQSVEQSAWDDVRVSFSALREHKDQAVRSAVLALLVDAMRSGENAAMSTSYGRGIETLCSLIDWSEREAGQALLSWFDDRSISTASLAPVFRAISRTPMAPDFASIQALTPASPPIQRGAVRDGVAGLYVLPTSPSDGWIDHAWGPAVARALGEPRASDDHVGALARAATFARLSASALLRWAGDETESQLELDRAFDAVSEARARIIADSGEGFDLELLTSPASLSDGRFVVAYTAAGRNAESRFDAIRALDAVGGPIGPADADVLAEASYFAVPITNRRAAQDLAIAHSDSIVMTHALIEALDRAPRLDLTTQYLTAYLGTAVPDHSEPDWSLRTRTLLVARLHEQIAASRRPLVSALAEELDRSVGVRAGATLASSTQTARAWYQGTEREASRYLDSPLIEHTPARVEARHDRRVAIAQGPIQRFAAHQISGVELLAYIVAVERPSAEGRVREILSRLDTDREASSHIFQQIESAERALLELLAIRLAVRFDESEAAP